MKQIQSQQGYALLIVLLVIVLFLGLSATFMAGTLNNAKQEKTVDTTNQAVAAAEMGVIDYAAGFEMDIDLVKEQVSAQTQLALNSLISCIEPPTEANCDTAAERAQWQTKIDNDMRKLYLEEIAKKITQLKTVAQTPENSKKTPFSDGQISYLIKTVTSTPINPTDSTLKEIKVDIEVKGNSTDAEKKLSTSFKIAVPDTFLNPHEAIKIDTVVIGQDKDVTYEDIFQLNSISKTCLALVDEVKAGTARAPYECKAQSGEKLTALIGAIQAKGLNPDDFRVFTDSFVNYVCDNNCNSLDFRGISVVVQQTDQGAFNNMNNLVNGDLIINGKLMIGNNIINLGKNGVKQNIIVKELDVGINIKNMYYTNFLVLGRSDGTPAALEWGNHFEISNYSRLCIDIDRIKETDLTRLSKEVDFSNSGSLIYYTKDSTKSFSLTGTSKRVQDSAIYVTRMDNYTTFLENCGVTLKNTQTVPTDVPVPSVIDTGFDFEVDY